MLYLTDVVGDTAGASGDVANVATSVRWSLTSLFSTNTAISETSYDVSVCWLQRSSCSTHDYGVRNLWTESTADSCVYAQGDSGVISSYHIISYLRQPLFRHFVPQALRSVS